MKNRIKDKEIGLRIMNLRLDRGYSRESLAGMAGISARFLSEIEKDKKGFSAGTLVKLADALEVSTDYIMMGHSGTKFDERIAQTLGKFEPGVLEKVEELLQLVYDIAHIR